MLLRLFLLNVLWMLQICVTQQMVYAQDTLDRSSSDQAQSLTSSSSDMSQTDSAPMRLRLKNNGFGTGKIVPSNLPDIIGWQNQGFAEPFFFDVAAVRSISTIQAVEQVAKGSDQFLIESVDGQSLTGKIIGLDSEWLTVRSAILGEVKLPVANVGQLVRADYTGEVVYPGLNQQQPWTPISPSRDWEIRAGVLTATKQGAAIVGDVKLPAKCELVLSLAWKGVPDFVVSLGTDAGERSSGQVVSTARLEVWNRNIILVRETDDDADLKRLTELNEKNPQVEFTVLIDQESGLVAVQDVHGRLLGKLQVPQKTPRIGPAIHIVNHGPSLTVERLEVRKWNGTWMLGREPSSQIVLNDQTTLGDSWLSSLQEDGQFVVETKDGKVSNISADKVISASLRSWSKSPSVQADQTDGQPPESAATTEPENQNNINEVEVTLSDRSRLKGRWLAEQHGKLALYSTWCEQELLFAAEHALSISGTEQRFSPDLTAHRNGVIKIGDTELSGFLAEEVAVGGANAIRWQPHGGRSSSAVIPTAQGSIAYRLQLPISASGEPTGRLDELLSQQDSGNKLEQSVKATSGDQQDRQMPNHEPAVVTREIVFASGDTIDGYVERADEKGIYFLSPQTEVRFVEHDKLDRLWLNSMPSPIKKAANEKIQRLMTVPRARKDDPPTHLLISVSGDFLRGRLVGLSNQSAQFDVRTSVAEIPREKIAQIVWLHQRTWNQPKSAETTSPDDYAIHVVQQERGLTFSPSQIRSGVLLGNSPLLGPCQIAIKQISQIMFGPNLSQRVSTFRENPWVLSLAQLPRAELEGESESDSESGVDSPLIGKPAPQFSLKQLDGQTVKLSDLNGRVVVLDFWASWCGPCMKTLPLVHEVVSNMDPEEVQLVAVNIQESESRARAAIEKLVTVGLVALDQDGEVAASYQATAIPQTVVIDSTGIVRFVFVGASKDLGVKLKFAIDEILGNAS